MYAATSTTTRISVSISTSSQLWRAIFPADARNGNNYSRKIKLFFLTEAKATEQREIEGRKVQKSMSDGRGREKKRKREKER